MPLRSCCRIYERLKEGKQAEDDAHNERERLVDLMYQEQVASAPRGLSYDLKLHLLDLLWKISRQQLRENMQ